MKNCHVRPCFVVQSSSKVMPKYILFCSSTYKVLSVFFQFDPIRWMHNLCLLQNSIPVVSSYIRFYQVIFSDIPVWGEGRNNNSYSPLLTCNIQFYIIIESQIYIYPCIFIGTDGKGESNTSYCPHYLSKFFRGSFFFLAATPSKSVFEIIGKKITTSKIVQLIFVTSYCHRLWIAICDFFFSPIKYLGYSTFKISLSF